MELLLTDHHENTNKPLTSEQMLDRLLINMTALKWPRRNFTQLRFLKSEVSQIWQKCLMWDKVHQNPVQMLKAASLVGRAQDQAREVC